MNLNFTLKELIHSEVAIKNKIANIPSVEEYDNLMLLIVNLLQPIRDYFKSPVIISSGYRSKRVNKLVGGAVNSQHQRGTCADFIVKNHTVEETYKWIKENLKYTELIQEHSRGKTWVHVEYNQNFLQKENLIYKNGKYIADND